MLVFSTARFSSFSFRADFVRQSFANVSFFDTDRSQILFHLSLRANEALAVCNRRGATPKDWGTELQRPVSLNPIGNSIDIHFSPPHVSVHVNGKRVFRFGALMGRQRFPNLENIAFVDYQGGIQASTINMDYKGSGGDGLTLSPRLELRGRLRGEYDPEDLHLEIEGVHPAPALIVSTDRTDTVLRSILPGRIWQNQSGDAALKLRIMRAGMVLAEHALQRSELLERVSEALASGDLAGDPVFATQMIEHARFSGITTELEPQLRDRLTQLAIQLGLDRFLTSSKRRVPDLVPTRTELETALAQVAQALNSGETSEILLEKIRSLAPSSEDLRIIFYIALSEAFCQRDAFDELYAQARTQIDTGALQIKDDIWFNSGLLPYLLRDGRIQQMCEVLVQLADRTGRWIMTPPLAWTIRAGLKDPTVPNALRDQMVSGFLRFLELRSGDYWQRTHCTQLTETAVAVLADRPGLSPRLARWVETALLQAMGMSRLFWTRIADLGVTLSPRMEAAKDAFLVLSGSNSHPSELNDALTFFERVGCPDCPRIRRDIFGPSGVPGTQMTDLSALLRAGLDPAEAALRQMAAPDATSTDPKLDAIVRSRRASLPNLVDRAPRYELQCATSRRATNLLRAAQGGDDPVSGCAELLPDLERLGDETDGWIGFGVAVGLLNGLLDAGANNTAGLLTDWLKSALNWEKSRTASVDLTPAIAMPLMGLQRRAAAGHTRAQAALDRLELTTSNPPPVAQVPLGEVNPLFDTVVLVTSCQANLDSRIPEMRAGWLSRLSALGVPYVIVAGDGTNTLDGDILYLDAPDDYEGLPQKTLAAIRWVHDSTSFTHMLKIDDDCLLNPEEYFHSLSYRKFDYYGRALTRVPGQMDRAWHCFKSTSPRGRLEFDKSPEPSSYCDGGSGYALSRRAMAELLDAAAGSVGQALIQVSFMEDKLVGDLLALSGIAPANEDYYISVRRRAAQGGIAVSRWVNGFDASQSAPVKLVHLDDARSQAPANRRLDESGLFPKKIWPSYQPAKLGEQTNALEMVTDSSRLTAAREAPVAVVSVLRNEMFMLPHFLSHYRKLGVESFLIADNCSDDGTLEYLADQPDVALFSVDTDYNRSQYGVAWQQALMAHFRTGKWSLVADADELLVWQKPQQESLPDLLRRPDIAAVEAARIFMLDMYPQGPLEKATFASGDPFTEAGFTDRVPFLRDSFGRGPYSNAPTWTSALRHRLIPGSRRELFVAQKIALLKYSPFMRLSAGLHYVAGADLASRELFFGHFKYNADFRRKAQAEVARRQHFNNAEEYRKYLALLSEGRDCLYDPELSVPWFESDFVTSRLG